MVSSRDIYEGQRLFQGRWHATAVAETSGFQQIGKSGCNLKNSSGILVNVVFSALSLASCDVSGRRGNASVATSAEAKEQLAYMKGLLGSLVYERIASNCSN